MAFNFIKCDFYCILSLLFDDLLVAYLKMMNKKNKQIITLSSGHNLDLDELHEILKTECELDEFSVEEYKKELKKVYDLKYNPELLNTNEYKYILVVCRRYKLRKKVYTLSDNLAFGFFGLLGGIIGIIYLIGWGIYILAYLLLMGIIYYGWIFLVIICPIFLSLFLYHHLNL